MLTYLLIELLLYIKQSSKFETKSKDLNSQVFRLSLTCLAVLRSCYF